MAKAAVRKATEVSKWKSKSRHPVFLELPSGNVCQAINKGLKVFREEGIIPNALMPIVDRALTDAQGLKPKEARDLLKDPSAVSQMLELTDAIVVSCVLDPDIQPVPKAEIKRGDELVWVVVEEKPVIDCNGIVVKRDSEVLYVDECDLDDKLFVLNWAMGGTKDLVKFRSESDLAVADIQGS